MVKKELTSLEILMFLMIAQDEGTSGIQICRDLAKKNWSINIGQIGTVLARMEANHWLTSVNRRQFPDRGGRPRKIYSITECGKARFEPTFTIFKRLMLRTKL